MLWLVQAFLAIGLAEAQAPQVGSSILLVQRATTLFSHEAITSTPQRCYQISYTLLLRSSRFSAVYNLSRVLCLRGAADYQQVSQHDNPHIARRKRHR